MSMNFIINDNRPGQIKLLKLDEPQQFFKQKVKMIGIGIILMVNTHHKYVKKFS